MSWVSTSKHRPVPRIADKDIPIFKIVEDIGMSMTYLSRYMQYKYVLAEHYHVEFPLPQPRFSYIHNQNCVSYGFHSYRRNMVHLGTAPLMYKKAEKAIAVRRISVESNLYKGFVHEYIREDELNLLIVNGYIPKGSLYYCNKFGHCVSEEIVLTNVVCRSHLNHVYTSRTSHP